MNEMTSTSAAGELLTPRQDRLENAIVTALRAGQTRSQLRDHVLALADFLRVRGTSMESAVQMVRMLGARATPLMSASSDMAVGDAPADRITMMVRWCTTRYRRAD